MKLNKVILNNYRQFFSLHEFDFSKKNNKGINIIVAKNGFGKSTIYRAINWCLFNKEPRIKQSQTDTLTQLNDHAEFISKKGDRNEMFVEIQFQDETNDDKIITIKRTASYLKISDQAGNMSSESILADRKIELKYFTKNKGQEIINNDGEVKIFVDAHILNDNLKNFFFFDGEELSEFIQDNKAKSIESDIDVLTGISDIEKTRINLQNWKKNVEKSIPKIMKKGDALREAEKECGRLNSDINSYNKIINGYKERLKELPAKIDELTEFAQADNIAKQLNDSIDEIDKKIEILEIQIEEINRDLNKDIATKFSTLTLQKSLQNFFESVQTEIDNDKLPPPEIKGAKAIEALIDDDNQLSIIDPNDKSKKNIYATVDWKNGINKEDFIKAIKDFNLFAEKQRDSSYKELAQGGYKVSNKLIAANDLKSFEDSCIKGYSKVNRKKDEITKLQSERSKHTRNLDKIDQDKFKDAAKTRIELIKEKDKLEKDLYADEKTLKYKKNDFERAKDKVEKEKKNLNLNSDDEKKLKFINDCLGILAPSIDQARKENLKSISDYFGSTFEKNCHKPYQASINDDFKISVLNDKYKELALPNSKRLSEGETYLAGFSYMLAMKTMTHYNFPFIIDTPLASCDDEYRLSIMTLFANLTSDLTNSHATFLFTPSEYDKNVIEAIDGHVSNHYELGIDENDNATVKKVI